MKDPVIVVTGAGKGIGRAIVLDLISRSQMTQEFGAPRILAVSRTEFELQELKAIAVAQGGVQFDYWVGDIADPTAGGQIVQRAMSHYGRLDCLINNAGVGRFGDFLDLTLEDFDTVMETNLRGTFVLTQEAFRVMKAQGSGHFIFVTSVAAEKAFEQSAIYCMSKFGQKGLVEVLRLYGYRHNIRVTNVMP